MKTNQILWVGGAIALLLLSQRKTNTDRIGAFIKKSKNFTAVHHGTNGLELERFYGADRDEQAADHMRMLHRKHNPLVRNRGKNAARRF
ncbi:MAG: hypothetical protein AAF847_00260 [Bacteroidota bacterium]